MNPSLKYNPYYHYLKFMVGDGFNDNTYIPGVGAVYSYRTSLKRGAGHRFFRRHRGLGFASFFTSLFSRAAPLLRKIGTHAVDVFSNIAKDTIQGENIKSATTRNLKEAIPALSKIVNPTIPSPSESVSITEIPKKRKSVVISSPIIKRKKTIRPTYTALKKL